VLIGGSGEKKTLRMVAQYADACNVFGSPEQIRHLMDVLDQHCATQGRDPEEICRTRLGTLILGRTHGEAQAKLTARLGGAKVEDLPEDLQVRVRQQFIVGDADAITERVNAFLAAGLDGLIFNMPDAYDLDAVAYAGEVLRGIMG
jgi:alkanesulfonate monooxygenase SsuD/methylene tetrahydromethanopterin reductase-like flavin-dependent oxidoreductase (luciferase family)